MLKLSRMTLFSFLFISASTLSTFATETEPEIVVTDTSRGGADKAPQTVDGVLKDCETRIKMVDNKEYLFKAPPKPTSPLKWSKWKKDVALLEEKKKHYLETMDSIKDFYQKESAKIKKLSPNDSKYSSTFQELYSNCKRFTDGLATTIAGAVGIDLDGQKKK